MAKLYFRYGAMNSGKSTTIIQVAYNYEQRGQNILIVKPAVDTKDTHVLSRLDVKRAVDIHAKESDDLFEKVSEYYGKNPIHCILVDEVQFLSVKQIEQLFLIVVRMKIPVICFGLRSDFQLQGFPASSRLLELAHSIEEMKTICRCGRKAMCNGRKVNGEFVREGSQVAIELDHVEYESLCPECYDEIIGLNIN